MSRSVLNGTHDEFSYLSCGLLTARRKTRPIVKVNYTHFAVGRDYAVTTINADIKNLGRSITQGFELIFVEIGIF